MTERAHRPGKWQLPLYFSQAGAVAWGMQTSFLTAPTLRNQSSAAPWRKRRPDSQGLSPALWETQEVTVLAEAPVPSMNGCLSNQRSHGQIHWCQEAF